MLKVQFERHNNLDIARKFEHLFLPRAFKMAPVDFSAIFVAKKLLFLSNLDLKLVSLCLRVKSCTGKKNLRSLSLSAIFCSRRRPHQLLQLCTDALHSLSRCPRILGHSLPTMPSTLGDYALPMTLSSNLDFQF